MNQAESHSTFFDLFADTDPAPIHLDLIKKVESELGITFPQSYVNFAARFGAIKTPCILDLVTGGESEIAPEGASLDVWSFLTDAEIVDTTKLYWEADMDDWVITIASDCMGNMFGFRKEQHETRPDDSVLYLFDHDYCKTRKESDGFDSWLQNFIRMKQL